MYSIRSYLMQIVVTVCHDGRRNINS